MSRRVDKELDRMTDAIVTLDRREIGLDRRLEDVEGKLRTDQAQTARDRGLPADLVSVEQNGWRRFTPGRNRWPAVAEFDQRVAELEMRQAEIHRRIGELGEKLLNAPSRDAQALAAWQLNGEKGPRPEPTAPGIKEELERRQLEWESFNAAVASVLAEKVEHVEKHRKRLVREVDDHVERARTRYLELVDQLAEARQDLYGLRRAAVWARLYPAEQSTREVADTFAGQRKRPLAAMGLTGPVAADRVLDGLRADAEWLAEAATDEQKLAIAGIDPRTPPNTRWDRTEEGQQWQRDERQRALERLRNPQ
jgi:hypothetical protein